MWFCHHIFWCDGVVHGSRNRVHAFVLCHFIEHTFDFFALVIAALACNFCCIHRFLHLFARLVEYVRKKTSVVSFPREMTSGSTCGTLVINLHTLWGTSVVFRFCVYSCLSYCCCWPWCHRWRWVGFLCLFLVLLQSVSHRVTQIQHSFTSVCLCKMSLVLCVVVRARVRSMNVCLSCASLLGRVGSGGFMRQLLIHICN